MFVVILSAYVPIYVYMSDVFESIFCSRDAFRWMSYQLIDRFKSFRSEILACNAGRCAVCRRDKRASVHTTTAIATWTRTNNSDDHLKVNYSMAMQ